MFPGKTECFSPPRYLKLIGTRFATSCKRRLLKLKSAYKSSGPSGQSLVQFLYEATRNISAPPWMGCYSASGLAMLSLPVYTYHSYTSGWRDGTVKVECLTQEHNTMSPTRARTWTALWQSGLMNGVLVSRNGDLLA